jgi:hypothetical protein
VTVKPSAVSSDTVRPWNGSVPVKLTTPAAGDATASPSSPPMSTPLCWPASYSLEPTANGRNTAPEAGQLQAAAVGERTSAAATATTLDFVAERANTTGA